MSVPDWKVSYGVVEKGLCFRVAKVDNHAS